MVKTVKKSLDTGDVCSKCHKSFKWTHGKNIGQCYWCENNLPLHAKDKVCTTVNHAKSLSQTTNGTVTEGLTKTATPKKLFKVKNPNQKGVKGLRS